MTKHSDLETSSSDSGTELIKQYVSKSLEYTKLKTFQLATMSISMIAKMMIVGSILSLGFVFMAISLAIFLGELLVGVLMLFIALILFLLRKYFDKNIIVKMSKIFFD